MSNAKVFSVSFYTTSADAAFEFWFHSVASIDTVPRVGETVVLPYQGKPLTGEVTRVQHDYYSKVISVVIDTSPSKAKRIVRD